jgi:tetratricopeptide (TPR) repeat protein
MPSKKSENDLSARFDNLPSATAHVMAAAAVAGALLLAACGGTTPSRPSAEAPVAVPTESARASSEADVEASSRSAAEAERPAETALPESRRGRRRGRDAEPAESQEPVEVPAEAALAYERALAEMAAENWIEAELALEQLVLEHTEFAGPYVNLAIVYMQDGRDDEARTALEEALAIDPAHAVANNQHGILLRRAGEFAAAEDAYRRAIEADPQYLLAYYNLGVLLDLYLHRPAEALECYELYQSSLGEPDQKVGRWIIDLRRRLGSTDNAARVAQEGGQ